MATRRQGRTRSRAESRNEKSADNHAEFMVAMANLANTMEANAAATLQAVQRFICQVSEVQPTLRKRIIGFRPWSVRYKHSMFRTTSIWSLLRISFWERLIIGGKENPACYREAKEMELMQLKQGSLSVSNYTSRFEELYDIMTAVAPLEIRIFSDLVNKARIVEEYAKTVASSRDTLGETTSRERDDHLGPRGQNFKKDGHTPQHLQGQGNFRRNNNAQYHHMKGSRLCYACGLPGHLDKNCRRKKNQNMGQNQQPVRVFTMDAKETTELDSLM
ncbi:hypothetical protein AHAS_Ahas11G0181300 [Arachis hypogaea]